MYANLFLLFGIIDTGHIVGISDRSQRYALYHQIQEYGGENYTTNATDCGFFLAKEKTWYSLATMKMGVEQHHRSKLFDKYYLIASPKFTIGTRRPDINFAVSIDAGKGFWSLSKDRIGKDVKGYNETTTGLFSVSISVDKFMNTKIKD